MSDPHEELRTQFNERVYRGRLMSVDDLEITLKLQRILTLRAQEVAAHKQAEAFAGIRTGIAVLTAYLGGVVGDDPPEPDNSPGARRIVFPACTDTQDHEGS